MAYKNRSQRMKYKRVKDPVLKQITNGTKMKNDANLNMVVINVKYYNKKNI